MDNPTPQAAIELLVEKIDHLFDPLDPFPIPSRDLAKSAENFIVGWARELPSDSAFRIIVHVPARETPSGDAGALKTAFSRHFTSRAVAVTGDLHELFRVGRTFLAIGLGVLAACMLGGRLAGALLGEGLARILSEGLIILGWVANWRPMEIFLYDWWPLIRQRRLYRRLAASEINIQPY